MARDDLTAAQLRAARAALGMSAERLAELSQVGLRTIRRAEQDGGAEALTAPNLNALRVALESQGVIFIEADKDRGPGIRLSKKAARAT